MRSILVAFVFLCATHLCTTQALAAPTVTSISGTVTNGSTLTITGASFGTKGVAAPLKFDKFESGTGNIANGWAISTGQNCGAPAHPPDYSTAVIRTNSTKSARARFDEATDPGCGGDGAHYSSNFGITGTPLPVIYTDAWVYYAPASPESRNVKLMRVHTNTYAPNLYFNIYCYQYGANFGQDGGPPTIELPSTPWRGSTFFAGNWRHIQMYLVESSPNISDGTAVLTVDNVNSINRVGSFLTRTSSGQFWDTVWFGNYVGHDALSGCGVSPGNTYVYWDDAYVDTTRAHVEIGNAASYSLCSHTEIQIPTSWSSNSITITANQGSFASLANTYLYVVDRNGAVNTAGYPVTSTGGGDAIPPAATRDLRSRVGS